MTLSHAIKNISQYRRRYGLSKALKTSIHYGYVTLNKNRLKKVVKSDFGKDPIIGEDLMTINI